VPAEAETEKRDQKISLKTPVRVSRPTIKMMAIIHRIIFISFSLTNKKTFPVNSIAKKMTFAASLARPSF
jgi:hypothetical protein